MTLNTFLFFSLLFIVSFFLFSYLSKPKCDRCDARALNFRHLRVDGQPDLRYKNNPIVCYKCGATEESIKYEAIRKVNEYKVTKKYQSAYTGDASSQFELGYLYYSGVQVVRDEIKAREWYEKAAEQGHARAQYYLGLMYFYGEGGVRQDLSVAKDFYRKSCENGCKNGCEEYKALDEVGY